MVERLEDLPEKVQAIEQKLDVLTTSVDARFDAVDARFDSVDARFDEVTAALVEGREYTEFAFQQLRSEMNAGFGRLERKLDIVIDRISDLPPRTP